MALATDCACDARPVCRGLFEEVVFPVSSISSRSAWRATVGAQVRDAAAMCTPFSRSSKRIDGTWGKKESFWPLRSTTWFSASFLRFKGGSMCVSTQYGHSV